MSWRSFMARPKKNGKHRINLELSEVTNEQLERLVQRANAETRTEVIRNALRIYDFLLELEEKGGQALIKRDGETMLLKLV